MRTGGQPMKVITLTLRLHQRFFPKVLTVTGFILLLFLVPLLAIQSSFLLQVLSTSFLYAALSLSWNLLAYSGHISLGHAAFFGLGAYGSALFALNFDTDPFTSIWAGGLAGALLAAFSGILFARLRGAYFALATLALVEIPKMIADNWVSLTRGSLGLLNIPPFKLPLINANSNLTIYLVNLSSLTILLLVVALILNSRWGWALRALRQDEKVSMTIGINSNFYTLITISVSGFGAGICGAIFAHSIGIIEPGMVFSLHYSALPMVMALFGGRFSVIGPVVGSLVLTLLDQFVFQPIFPSGHQILYGLAIMITILFMPGGLMGLLGARKHGITGS
ncbi:MAG TPA: branched-chain amino acid ABC transporter permease [Deltaproteobacteria bacterium]|nr:branched-chain amino acid ABC transporter permease [Deltaproteobacteria bacterium]